MSKKDVPPDEAEFGTRDAARDGEPVEDDLAARRRGRTGAQLATDGAEVSTETQFDGQVAWEVEPDERRPTFGPPLVPRNTTVEYKVKIQGRGVPLKGGVNGPRGEQVVVASLMVEKYDISYTRDDRGEITKVTITEVKTQRSVNPVRSEAAQLMLGGEAPAA